MLQKQGFFSTLFLYRTQVNYLQKGGISMSDQEIESMLSTMQSSGQVKREGNVMKMSVDYKYGQTNFLTE